MHNKTQPSRLSFKNITETNKELNNVTSLGLYALELLSNKQIKI